MNETRVEAFDRAFGSGDASAFQDLVRGFIGKRLSRWRETYADGIVLDFGPLVPKSVPAGTSLPSDRGEWVIRSWGCDISFREQPSAPRVDAFEQVKASLAKVVDRHVLNVTIAPDDLSLTVGFEGGSEILLRTDRDDPELDQWFITTPSGASVGASAAGNWYYRL